MVHIRAGIVRELASRVHQRVLRWFWHVERIDEYLMTRERYGGRLQGRQRLGWIDGVKVALGSKALLVEGDDARNI